MVEKVKKISVRNGLKNIYLQARKSGIPSQEMKFLSF